MHRRLHAAIWVGLLSLSACGSSEADTSPTDAPATAEATPAAPDQVVGCPASVGPGGPVINSVFFGDKTHGIVAGTDGFLWQTGDDGVHWVVVGPPAGLRQINGVNMTDPKHVWLWGDGGLFTITVGDKSWAPVPTHLSGGITGVAFVGALPVAAVSNKGGVAVKPPDSDWAVRVAEGAAPPLDSIVAPDVDHLYAVGEKGTILASADGGVQWVSQATGTTKSLHGVAFTTPQAGLAVGDSTTLLTTNDAGVTWIRRELRPTSADLSTALFIDATHGWIVGAGGQVLRTKNGGRGFSPSVVTDAPDLHGVFFQTPTHGWTVGSHTGIYETKDGGIIWQRRNFCAG